MMKLHAILLATALVGALAGTASAAKCPPSKGTCQQGTGNCTGMSASGQCTQMTATTRTAQKRTAASKPARTARFRR